MFETLPSGFFNLLVSKNREIYIEALFVLRKAVRQDLYLTREDLNRRISIALEEKIKNSIIEDDGQFEDEDLSTVNAKAAFIIRKLRDYGWINIDFNAKASLEDYIAVPAYSTLAINFLYLLIEGNDEEYNSLVYSTYAVLMMSSTENNNYFDALITAYKNTDKLNEALANLFYGIRSIEQRIVDNIEINQIASIHFNEYLDKLHEFYYHPYKTFDSIDRFASPITKMIRNWQQSPSIRKKMLENAKEKNPGLKQDALYEMIAEKYDLILSTYENIEEKMFKIDEKINEYTAATIDKMKHLINMDETYKGKVNYLVQEITKNREFSDDICDLFIKNTSLQLQENVSKESTYNKREVFIAQDLPPVFVEDPFKDGEDVDEMFFKIKEGYNISRIKAFILSKVNGGKEISIEDMHISNDEDFILSILAMLRGDEKELPFTVAFEEGYIRTKNYLVPNIKFIMKEGKK